MEMVLRKFMKSSDSKKIDISVCIANYNGEKVITDCLSSIYAQKGELRIEIIVHDDASSDASLEIIRNEFPAVKIISSSANVGFCVSNNRMAREAAGQYLLLLNNDATLFSDALITLHQTAENHRECILTLPQYDATHKKLLDCGMSMDFFANPIPLTSIIEREVAMVMGACLWIPRTLWQKLDGLPEWFGSLGEDMYLCCFSRLAGYPVIALGKSGYWHHVGYSFGGGKVTKQQKLETSFKRRTLSESNKTKVMLLFYPLSALLLLAPLHFTLLLIEGGCLALLRCDPKIFSHIYWPAVIENIAHIRTIARHRVVVQRLRNSTARDFFRQFQSTPYKLKMLIKYGVPTIH